MAQITTVALAVIAVLIPCLHGVMAFCKKKWQTPLAAVNLILHLALIFIFMYKSYDYALLVAVFMASLVINIALGMIGVWALERKGDCEK